MKKILNILLVTLLAVSLAACNSKTETAETTTEESVTEEVVGGYTLAESPEITDEVKTLVEKATGDLIGASYTPVAYIGSQIVSGTNHLVLCKKELVTATPVTSYVILEIYEDLSGNAEINSVLENETVISGESLLGGWSDTDSPVLADETIDIFNKAIEGLVGSSYNPIALVASQLVSGTNYCFLAELTPVVPDAQSHYALVTVYADTNGNAELKDFYDFNVLDTDDGGYVVEYSSLEEMNELLGARLFTPTGDVKDERFTVYYEADGTKIGEYDYTLDLRTYNVRFCDNFTYSMAGVVLGDEELYSDPNADNFGEFSVTNAMIFYVAHWLTVDGQYSMTTDTNDLTEENFTSIASEYHDGTIAKNS